MLNLTLRSRLGKGSLTWQNGREGGVNKGLPCKNLVLLSWRTDLRLMLGFQVKCLHKIGPPRKVNLIRLKVVLPLMPRLKSRDNSQTFGNKPWFAGLRMTL